MTTQNIPHHATDFARIVATVPVLVATLLGAIPLVIMCLACRCCRAGCAQLREYLHDRLGRI